MNRFANRLLNPVLDRMLGTLVAVRTAEKLIALTFDDGPDPESTPRLLDALARQGAKATFFMVGSRAAAYPDLVARVAAEGHDIGNHSWDHPILSELRWEDFTAQITRTRAALAPHGRALMRPPYGQQSLKSYLHARRLGYRVVCWNGAGFDWLGDDAATMAERLLDRIGPGAILLMHDSLYTFDDERYRDRAPTIAACEMLMTKLADHRFVTVTELLRRGRAVNRRWIGELTAEFLDSLRPATSLS